MAKIQFTCEQCNKEFLEYKSNRVKKHIFCSKSCADKGKMVGVVPWNKGFGEYIKGNKNPAWKGNMVGYTALHDWVKVRLAKPLACNHCGKIKALNLANKSHKYKRSLNDWLWLCSKCHGNYDSGKNRGSSTRIWKMENDNYKERIII